jgi:cyclase
VVKGTRFEGLRDIGEPAELAERYEAEGADEIVFLDISASVDERATSLEAVRRTAERLFIPLTVGGGIRSVSDAELALRSGADKVSVNSAAIAQPELIGNLADRFGRQCVVASVDAKEQGDGWRVFSHGGTRDTGLDTLAWTGVCVARGAGEVLLTSIDRDGTRSGYDVALTARVARAVSVPVIASGGAGSASDVETVFLRGAADAALVAGIVHDGDTSVREIKNRLSRAGIPTRPA